MAFITINSQFSNNYREEKLQGRDHIVVPVTMIVPGVLNGSSGPGYYSKETISKRPQNWNGMPIVAPDHPVSNGVSVSARHPDILNKYGVGVVLNSTADGSLKAEAWLDKARTEQVDARILWSIYNNEPIEVSTGLDLVRNKSKGKFNNVEFDWTAGNLQPDHLAILTETIGACSIKDGCGLLVNKLSHDQIRTLLQDLLRVQHADPSGDVSRDLYIEEVYPTEVIYNLGGELRSQRYTRNQKDVTFDGVSTLVQRKVSYEVVNHVGSLETVKSNSPEKGPKMDKEKLVASIINSGCDCWGTDDKETLNGFSEDKLQKIQSGIERSEKNKKIVNTIRTGMDDGKHKITLNADETGILVAASETQPKVSPVTIENAVVAEPVKLTLADLPKEIQDLVEFAKNSQDTQRVALIESLSNGDEAIKATLKDKSLSDLILINSFVPAKVENSRSYKGRGGAVVPTTNASTVESEFDDDAVLSVTAFNFSGE